MSPILTQATPMHLFIAYAVVVGPLALVGAGTVLAVRRWGGAR